MIVEVRVKILESKYDYKGLAEGDITVECEHPGAIYLGNAVDSLVAIKLAEAEVVIAEEEAAEAAKEGPEEGEAA